MKIAFFTDSYFPRINGVTLSIHTYAKALAEKGHKICIVCPDYSDDQMKNSKYDISSEENNTNFTIIRVPSVNLIWSKEDRATRIDQWHFIKKQMDLFKPEILHINTEFNAGYYGVLYARHRKLPFISTFHTMWEDYLHNYLHFIPNCATKKLGKQLIKFYLKYATLVITPTEEMSNVIKKYGTDKPIRILPTGVDEKTFVNKNISILPYVNRLYNFLPILKKKHILLYVGRIVKEKNLEFLFPVLEKVRQIVPDTALVFVGDGPERKNLEKKAAQLPFSWNIVFTGYKKREELSVFYNVSEVFVFPSKTETQGLVTIEAMLCGLPVVAIGEMGTKDVMQGNNGGFMVSDDVNEFSEKVINLLQDKELHNQKSEEAKKWGKQWSVEKLTTDLENYYNEAMEIYYQ